MFGLRNKVVVVVVVDDDERQFQDDKIVASEAQVDLDEAKQREEQLNAHVFSLSVSDVDVGATRSDRWKSIAHVAALHSIAFLFSISN